MCIIAVATKKRLNKKIIKTMWENNSDGGGVAWREDGLVKWVKGVDNYEEMYYYNKTLPFPFVLHFRITSTGETTPELTHPFVIDTTPTELQGETDKGVLFQNGTFNTWKDYKLLLLQRLKRPDLSGKWNDTRLLAYLTATYGKDFLPFVDSRSRFVYFTPTELILYGDWKEHNKTKFSNESYKERQAYQYYGNWYNDRYKNFRNQILDNKDWDDWR